MRARALFRFLPLLLACFVVACAGTENEQQTSYPPPDFSYLPVLALNVASVEVQTAFVPSGQPPDVSQDDPISPVATLRKMAEERLSAAGTSGKAVFVIDDASMTRSGDTITGVMSVTLNIYTATGQRAAFAQATVTRQITGAGENLQATLYELTRQLVQQMNIEFEYQVKRSLHTWLLTAGAPTPVQQAPLEEAPSASGAIPLSPPSSPPLPYAPPPASTLPEPVSGAPPAVPLLPSPVAPAAPLAPPVTSPPPPVPALPAPLAPAAPLPQPAPLPPPGPVMD